ncbi:hypothetical protein AcW1_006371 [Taiwanofungus camphoratus]|nr:hypothetical protein AcW1_006371 [Antrodia cinnamomea]
MDISATSRPIRPEPRRVNSTGRASRTGQAGEKLEEKAISLKVPQSAHRGTRYKEKFQALREKYEQVTATREAYERELAIADEKVKRLQEECECVFLPSNLLLDAVDIAVPAQPSLLHYLSRDPIPPQYHSYQVPFPAAPNAPPPPPPPPVRSRLRKSSSQTNGNGVKRK